MWNFYYFCCWFFRDSKFDLVIRISNCFKFNIYSIKSQNFGVKLLWVVTRMACVLFKKQNHRACVFYCILINVLTFAHNVPSSPSPRSNHLIYFPGRTPTNNNSSYMRSGNFFLSWVFIHFLFCAQWIKTFACDEYWMNSSEFVSLTFHWNYFRRWFWNILPYGILISIIIFVLSLSIFRMKTKSCFFFQNHHCNEHHLWPI